MKRETAKVIVCSMLYAAMVTLSCVQLGLYRQTGCAASETVYAFPEFPAAYTPFAMVCQ